MQLEETLPLLLGACAAGWSIMTGVVQDAMVGWMQTHVIRLQAQVCSKRGSNPVTFVEDPGQIILPGFRKYQWLHFTLTRGSDYNECPNSATARHIHLRVCLLRRLDLKSAWRQPRTQK